MVGDLERGDAFADPRALREGDELGGIWDLLDLPIDGVERGGLVAHQNVPRSGDVCGCEREFLEGGGREEGLLGFPGSRHSAVMPHATR